MTPTLFGRWQTRIFLFATIGILATLPFAWGLLGGNRGFIYFWVLGYILLFGLGWDILYTVLQKFRWDRDWPGILQGFAGLWEALFFLGFYRIFDLPGLSDLSLVIFLLHYSFVWSCIYLASQSVMRILFPYWRFQGGRLL